MKYTRTLMVAAALMGATTLAAKADDIALSFIMCGDLRPADQATLDQFQKDNPGVESHHGSGSMGHLPGQVDDPDAAANPVSVAYMGSRTLLKLSKEGLIVPAQIPADMVDKYQPGVLKTVSAGGKYWGYPHAFSTKALYINCDLVKAAGMECKAPETWADMITMAKAIKEEGQGRRHRSIAGKDFDNTMHMFLDFLYSNGGCRLECWIPAKSRWTASKPAKPCRCIRTFCPTPKKARPPGGT